MPLYDIYPYLYANIILEQIILSTTHIFSHIIQQKKTKELVW